MTTRLAAALLLAAAVAACDAPTPTPAPTPGPTVARLALPYAVQGRPVWTERPSLAAYPPPTAAERGETPYP